MKTNSCNEFTDFIEILNDQFCLRFGERKLHRKYGYG